MGVHDTAILIKSDAARDPVKLLQDLGFPRPEEVFGSVEDDCVIVSLYQQWSIVWGDVYPPLSSLVDLTAEEFEKYKTFDFLQPGLAALSRGTTLAAFVVEDTAGIYGFDWYADGKMVRSYWDSSEEVYRNVGSPLLEDETEYITDEDADIFGLLEKLTIPFAVIDDDDCDWRTFKFHWPQPAKKPAEKAWWKFW